MAFYDIVMLVVVAGAILFGWWKGLAWQIASLAAIILSYIVAVNFREPVSRFISAEEPWNRIGAMLALFLGTSLVIWTIYASISKSLKSMELKGFDRQAGALLGAVKGVILCMVITMFSVSLLGDKAHDAIHNSRSGRYVVKGITQVSSIVPGELAAYIQPHVDNFHEAIGHDGNLPDDQYPQFNQYQNEQTAQNPNTVPQRTYQGTWQATNQDGTSNAQQTGYQQNSYNGTFNQNPNSNQTQSTNTNQYPSNGWPDVNFKAQAQGAWNDAKQAVQETAAEAARRAFESSQQQR